MHGAGQIQLPVIPLQCFLYDCSCRKTLGYCANAKRTKYEACIALSLADLNKRKKTSAKAVDFRIPFFSSLIP